MTEMSCLIDISLAVIGDIVEADCSFHPQVKDCYTDIIMQLCKDCCSCSSSLLRFHPSGSVLRDVYVVVLL